MTPAAKTVALDLKRLIAGTPFLGMMEKHFAEKKGN